MSQNQFDKKSQAWSALFSEPMSDLVKRYTSSVFFDKRMWQADITGSLAHADMLAAQGIIHAADHASIQSGMATIWSEIESGAFEWKLDLEDVHLNIEARLTQLVGDAGKRLHTGRSRNDQVATDVRLWLRSELDLIGELLVDLQKSLVDVAEKNVDVILPGFTHLQVAQPVSFGHHMLAYVEMFSRDAERFAEVRRRTYDSVIRVNSQSGKGGIAFLLEREHGVVMPRRMQVEFSAVVQRQTDASEGEMTGDALWTLFQGTYLQAPTQAAITCHSHRIDEDGQGIELDVTIDGTRQTLRGQGNGPIAATVDALGLPLRVDHYEELATGTGANAQALAIVEAAMDGVVGSTFGAGASHNLVTASVSAIVSVANRLMARRTAAHAVAVA